MQIEGFFDISRIHYYIAAFFFLAICILWYLAAQNNKRMIKGFVLFSMLLHIAYLIWRAGFTIPLSSLVGFVLAVILLATEIFGFSQSLVYKTLFLKPSKSRTKGMGSLGYYPTVDIMITTYNEPDIVVRRTVAGASQLDYPDDKLNIYVCDDGSRESIRDICRDYGAHWITREDHKDAKAGNLNNCYINHSHGEFSVILDADMVPRSNFLHKTLGYFDEEDVAFVQTPQVFFNPDSFQRNLGLNSDIPNEQDFFMQEIQAHRQEYNALLFVGSGCVFRRTHLESIGFIPTGTITEDMATSLLLQNAGYRGVLTNDTYAQGLSAESFDDYISQRTRWCQGNIEVFKKWNPWKMKNLTFAQKVIITDGVSFWLFGIQKLVYIICPLFFVITGIPIMVTFAAYLLLFWLPSFVVNDLTMKLFSHRKRTALWSHIYETAVSPFLAVAALRAIILKKKRIFKVTPKGYNHTKTTFSGESAKPHFVLLGLSILALSIALYNIIITNDVSTILVYTLNGFWILYNLVAIVASIGLCFEKPRMRKYDRVVMGINLPITLDGEGSYSGNLRNLSEGGCNIAPQNVDHPVRYIDKKITVDIGEVKVTGTVLRYIPGKKSYAVKFDDISKDDYAKLVKFIFSHGTVGFGEFRHKFVIKAFFLKMINDIWVSILKRRYRRKNKDNLMVVQSLNTTGPESPASDIKNTKPKNKKDKSSSGEG